MRRFLLVVALISPALVHAGNYGSYYYQQPTLAASTFTASPAGPAPDVELSGLVAYFKFDEGAGTTAADSSGSTTTHTGTLNNGAAWVTGVSGSAVHLSTQASQYISFVNDSFLASTGSFTLCAWFLSTAMVQGPYKLYSEASTGTDTPFVYLSWAENSQHSLEAGIRQDNTSESYIDTGAGKISTGTFHWIAFVQTSLTSRALYLDNVLVGSNTDTLTAGRTTNNTNVGRQEKASITSYFPGAIDQLRVYLEPLSTARLTNIYNARQ